MYQVGTAIEFDAQHIMPGVEGPEGVLHSHDYRLEVVIEREKLDDRGMVCDLDVLTGTLAEVADRVRDRDLSETCGGEAVTVEVLAAWIHERLADPLRGDGAEVVSVRVWESEDVFGGIRARV